MNSTQDCRVYEACGNITLRNLPTTALLKLFVKWVFNTNNPFLGSFEKEIHRVVHTYCLFWTQSTFRAPKKWTCWVKLETQKVSWHLQSKSKLKLELQLQPVKAWHAEKSANSIILLWLRLLLLLLLLLRIPLRIERIVIWIFKMIQLSWIAWKDLTNKTSWHSLRKYQQNSFKLSIQTPP